MEEYLFGKSKNKMLGRMLGPKGEESIGCWRKLHNEELRSLLVYCSPNNIRMITASSMVRWARHVAHTWIACRTDLYKVLAENHLKYTTRKTYS
jgi:hypothetical protein